MKTFFEWLEGHPHEYLRISFVWMFAAVLSPWRIPMLIFQLVISMFIFVMYEKGMKA